MTSIIPQMGLAAQAAAGLLAGGLLGLLHFGSLWWNTRLFASGRFLHAFAIQLARFGLLLAVLFILAKMGALALLFGGLGLLAVRRLSLRQALAYSRRPIP